MTYLRQGQYILMKIVKEWERVFSLSNFRPPQYIYIAFDLILNRGILVYLTSQNVGKTPLINSYEHLYSVKKKRKKLNSGQWCISIKTHPWIFVTSKGSRLYFRICSVWSGFSIITSSERTINEGTIQVHGKLPDTHTWIFSYFHWYHLSCLYCGVNKILIIRFVVLEKKPCVTERYES